MPQAVLSLGPISFQEFEIPPSITFGGRQRIATHYLSSGARQIDTLGPDDAAISFAGILSGSNAAIRAREIDTLRSLGTPLLLAWSNFQYSVIISEFQAEYRNRRWIPYRLACTVVSDPISSSITGNELMVVDALASLNLMYDVVPVLPATVPDLRPLVSSASGARANTPALAIAAASLVTATSILTAEAANRELQLLGKPLSFAGLATTPAEYIFQMVEIAAGLQSLASALDCVGHAALCLREISP